MAGGSPTTGPGSTFGTGEIETMTNSTANVSHDGAGHLVLRSPHSGSDPATGWTPRPTSGEVDILEDINGRSSVFGTLHCGTSPGGPCNESTGIGSGERACAG